MIRRVGIDFGTSTTVVRVKNYEDDASTPIGSNALDCNAVKFNDADTVPSLVREWTNDSGERVCVCGAKAADGHPGSTLWAGFKMDLESADGERAEKAWALTETFFRYLYANYNEENLNGIFGDPAGREETWVSHPVKWRDATARRLAECAQRAGFQNVHLMNEAHAAIASVALRNTLQLEKELGLSEGDSYRFLLVDMGAGTTDLVLGNYTYAAKVSDVDFQPEVCWPEGEQRECTCGGREFDQRLTEYLQGVLRDNDVAADLLGNSGEKVKEWKDTKLSPKLADGETVSDFEPFGMYQQLMGQIIEFQLDRELVREIFHRELGDLIDLVNGCMAQSDVPHVDAVILVGGSSQWFFVKDLLLGALEIGDKRIDLKRRSGEKPVLLCVSRPQETVAQGLALAGLVRPQPKGDGADAKAETGGATVPREEKFSGVGILIPDGVVTPEKWREKYIHCFAERLRDLLDDKKPVPKGYVGMSNLADEYQQPALEKARDLAEQIVALLERRDEIKIGFEFLYSVDAIGYFLTGTVTREDCNAWAARAGYTPLFPTDRDAPKRGNLTVHRLNCSGSADASIDDIRAKQKSYQLTEEQKNWLRSALREMGKGKLLFNSAAVTEGYDSIPMFSGIYDQLNSKRFQIKRSDFQVYFCHRHKSLFGCDFMITDVGIITCWNKGESKVYSWYTLCLGEEKSIEQQVGLWDAKECSEQLRAILSDFLARLRKDFQIDAYTQLWV